VQADDPAPAEVLEKVGGPGLSARGRRVLVAVLAVVCLAGVVGWWVDARSRDHDERAVAACHDATLSADLRASSTVGYMVQEVAPALYKVSDARRDGLVALVAEAAGSALPGVRKALALCRSRSVAWWHRDLAHQRGAYIDYLEARVRRLEDVAGDGHHYYRDQPRLAALRDRAFGT
jgi:hypothetical protein